jgi:hypothetical protein
VTTWKNIGTDRKIILKQIFKAQDGREGIAFTRLRTGTAGGLF